MNRYAHMARRLAHLGLFLVVASIPAVGHAGPSPANGAACRLYATSLANDYINPPTGGDTTFFTSASGIPNVVFVIDSSCSMHDAPIMPQGSEGCADAAFNAAYADYDPTVDYPAYDPAPKNTPFTKLPKDGLFKGSRRNGPMPGDTATNCGNICGTDTACQSACTTCTTTKGYFSHGGTHYFIGNLVNYSPLTKWIVARKVVKDVINSVLKVRMGLAIYDNSQSGILSGAQWWQNDTLNPGCDHPSLSSFQNNRNSIINSIDNLMDSSTFHGSTPLSNALFDIGQYYTQPGQNLYTTWFSNTCGDSGGQVCTETAFDSSTANPSICASCQFSSVVLVTDGLPNEDDQALPPAVRNAPITCKYLSGGSCTSAVLPHVAWWLANHDFAPTMPGSQEVTTYTVGFSVDSPLLAEAAYQGGGFYVTATSSSQLQAGILSIVHDVVRRGLSFTTSSFNGVQSQASQSVLVPRLVPDRVADWKGLLYRYNFVSEFVIGADLDGDGLQNSVFLVGKSCDINWSTVTSLASVPAACKPIAVNPSDGLYYKRNSWLATDTTLSNTLAQPFWEAGQKLLNQGSAARRVYTWIDRNGDGNIDSQDAPPVLLKADDATATLLMPYLNIDPASPACTTIAAKLGLSTAITQLDCAKGLIRFIIGRKIDDSADRGWMLGDIFHSEPVVVEPPTQYDALQVPGHNSQSMVTLAQDTTFPSDAGGQNAWDVFAKAHKGRSQVVLVGANDGMLHAFVSGVCVQHCSGTDSKPAVFDETGSAGATTLGQELWAYIPPDQLPKLQFLIQGEHHYYVDGTPWVRDIWVDGGPTGDPTSTKYDYKRQPDEFHTVAVISEREGGTMWSALDVTDLDDPAYTPQLLWTFPKISSGNLVSTGESWSDITPLPPPIGPVRVSDPASPYTFNGTPFAERWIAAIPGGYDPSQARGRGFYFVDVWHGNSIWSFTFKKDDPIRGQLLYSIAAPPALTQWNDTAQSFTGGAGGSYFDTMVVGDTGGQVWTARFWKPDDPTKPDPANKKYWTAGRLFHDHNAIVDIMGHNPFFQISFFQGLEQTGYLRASLGTGDRANLRDDGGGTCTLDNLAACRRDGCTDINVDAHFKVGATDLHSHWHDKPDLTYDSDMTYAPSTDTNCGKIDVHVVTTMKNCPGLPTNSTDPVTGLADYKQDAHFTCTGDSTNFSCNTKSKLKGSLDLPCVDPSTWPYNRFYSLRVFGGNQNVFDDAPGASTYDTNHLVEGTTYLTVQDAATGLVNDSSAGWYYQYPVINERTASPGVTAGPTIVWSSLQTSPVSCQTGPGTGTTTGGGTIEQNMCGSGGDVHAWMYFRDYATGGSPNLTASQLPATGWDTANNRQSLGTQPQPPPPPQVITQVSKTGQTKATVATPQGGSVSTGDSDTLYQTFTQLPLTPALHDIRHAACDPSNDPTHSCQ